MTPEQSARLERMTMVGRRLCCKDKLQSGKPWQPGLVVDEVYIMVSDYKHLIPQIEFAPGQSWDGSRYAYRTGYYTYDKDMRNIKWGQYTQFLTEKDYRTLLSRARQKGWDLFADVK
jgi:hypothetical protein